MVTHLIKMCKERRLIREVALFIQEHRAAQVALCLAAAGDIAFWTIILNYV